MNVALCAQCGERPAQRPLMSSRGEPHTAGYWPCAECCGHLLHMLFGFNDPLDEFTAWLRAKRGRDQQQ